MQDKLTPKVGEFFVFRNPETQKLVIGKVTSLKVSSLEIDLNMIFLQDEVVLY